MQKLVPVVLLSVAASCGGKTKPAAPVPSNDTVAAETEGSGGETYGDDWGEYGGVGYGYGGEGYGGGSDHEEPYVPPPPQPPNIVGTWVQACKAGTGKGEFDTFTFVNTDAKWDLVIGIYGDAACTKRKSAIHLAGSYTFGAQSTTVPTGWEGNFTYEARDLTADDAKTAKAIGKLCGIKKMKAGTAVDIHEKGCPKMGFQPAAACSADYDLVALEGEMLRLGVRPADNDMCTPEKRPTALDTSRDNVFQYPATGIPECEAMIAEYRAYLGCQALPADQKGYVFEAIRESVPQMAQMGASTCQQVTDALKQGLASMGC